MFAKILKNWKRVLIIVIIISVIISAYFFFNKPTTNEIKYTTASVAKTNLTVTATASGSVVPTKQLNAGFEVAGKISEINVKAGDSVKVGQQLAKLDSTTLQNQLSQAQSGLNQAKNNLQNKLLLGKYTDYDIANLNEAINLAQMKVDSSKNDLNNAVLKSTIEGVVISLNNNVGDTVSGNGSNSTVSSNSSSSTSSSSNSQSSGVITIIDPNSFAASLSIGETDIAKIKVGQIAQVSFDALGEKKYTGKVQTVDSTATVSSNVVSYGVKISIDKVDQSIRSGMTANATIFIETKDNILTVPNGAVKTTNGQKTVQIMKGNSPQTVTVKIGLSNDTDTEIIEGLDEGDTVITGTNQTTTSTNSTQRNGLFSIGGAGNNRGNTVQGR